MAHHPHPLASQFIESLFSNATQATIAKYGMRPLAPGAPAPKEALDVSDAHPIVFDWSHWRELESALPRYEVKR